MLSLFDDYPIHQTPDPVAHPATTSKDTYERYWFNGYPESGEFFIAAAAAYYPHLGIRDAAVSVVIDGKQHAFHISGLAGDEPTDMTIGPWSLEIIEPMRRLRIRVADNDTGFSCDLTYSGRTGNVEEPRHHFISGTRRAMDTTRFTQWGRWEGWIEWDGGRLDLDGDSTLATKDRSWGVRSVGGGDNRGAPGQRGGIFFLWAPLHFGDECSHFQLFEDRAGRQLFTVGALVPRYESAEAIPGVVDPAVRHMRHLEHAVTFQPGTRMIDTAVLGFTGIDDGARREISMERLLTFRMKGIGYMHPEWGHGAFKGDLAMDFESWELDTVDQNAVENHHVQHLMKVTMDGKVGIGALEQLLIGPYTPYGLDGYFDPAP